MPIFIYRDKPPTFAEITGMVSSATIAIAVGKRADDDEPNIVGSGFAVEHSEIFVTAAHVIRVHDELDQLSKDELNKRGLSDSLLRIALLTPDGYTWREIENNTWFRVNEDRLDISILKTVGISIQPLALNMEEILFGTEVGILGYPLGNSLQGSRLRPFVLKSIISGGLEPTAANGLEANRIALGANVAGGFSGGPVFSSFDGSVLGMVASKKMELGANIQDRCPAGVSLAVPAIDINNFLKQSLPVLLGQIKTVLIKGLK